MTLRRIAVLSTTRADLSPLDPLITELAQRPSIDVRVVLTGSHGWAEPWQAATSGSDAPAHVWWPALIDRTTSGANGLVSMAAKALERFSATLASWSPEIVVVLGDRYEVLVALAAAVVRRVPVAHLHGGEITTGALDDEVRHAITKLAHLHFVAAKPYAARVAQLGEEDWRIHVVGAPALDRLTRSAGHPPEEIAAAVGLPLTPPVALLTYHPPTARPQNSAVELDALLAAAGDRFRTVIATHPGADPGSAAVLDRLHDWVGNREGAVLVPSLGALYPSAMRIADAVLGNSSSGIVEAPFLGVPVVNVGSRQAGRLRAPAVVDAPSPDDIAGAVSRVLDPAFRHRLKPGQSPYGDGHASTRIADVLVHADLDALTPKAFVDQVRT